MIGITPKLYPIDTRAYQNGQYPPKGSGTAKHFDDGKPRYQMLSVLPLSALMEVVKVMEFGAKKYGWNNWRGGMQWLKLAGSIMRHFLAWLGGEDLDKESGLNHLAHATCDILFLTEYVIVGKGVDDRIRNS